MGKERREKRVENVGGQTRFYSGRVGPGSGYYISRRLLRLLLVLAGSETLAAGSGPAAIR